MLDCFEGFKNLRTLHVTSWMPPEAPTIQASYGLAILSLVSNSKFTNLRLKQWDIAKDAGDLLCILSKCATTLVHLSLDIFSVSSHGTMPKEAYSAAAKMVPPVVRLQALRTIELRKSDNAQLPRTSRIECPNLKSLAIKIDADNVWDIPAWIPSDLSQLTLCKVGADSPFPRFGQSICPSDLTIDTPEVNLLPHKYAVAIKWIRECIDHLPFPNKLRSVTLKFRGHSLPEYEDRLCCPELEDYRDLSKLLLELHGHGALESVKLMFCALLDLGSEILDPAAFEASEGQKLKDGLSPLLSSEGLRVTGELSVRRGSDVFVQCSI
ncbi:hypothetical protein EYR36_005735 [Pleurotus pulmonarius]|nr:hypothetical protein EYR36_005735 [Pleurotus pulmonarius]